MTVLERHAHKNVTVVGPAPRLPLRWSEMLQVRSKRST